MHEDAALSVEAEAAVQAGCGCLDAQGLLVARSDHEVGDVNVRLCDACLVLVGVCGVNVGIPLERVGVAVSADGDGLASLYLRLLGTTLGDVKLCRVDLRLLRLGYTADLVADICPTLVLGSVP